MMPDSQIDEVMRWPTDTAGGSEGPCGWLKDRGGLSWQVTPTRLLELIADPDPNRARRAMEAMMKMNKINIAEVENAADGTEATQPEITP